MNWNTKFKLNQLFAWIRAIDLYVHFFPILLKIPGNLKVDPMKAIGFWLLFLFRYSVICDEVFFTLGIVLLSPLGAARFNRLPANVILFGVSLPY